MIRHISGVSAVCAAFLIVGCMRDPVGLLELNAPPTLPSLATMEIPTPGSDGLGKQLSIQQPAGLAHAVAVASVGYWTNLTAVTLAAPVSLFALVHATDPIALPDSGGWMWVVTSDPYRAVLTAVGGDGVVEWTMAVTCPGKKDFVWFTGSSNLDGTVGDWVFNDFVDGQAKYSFNYSVVDSTIEARAMVVDSDDASFGNYLKWDVDLSSATFVGYSATDRETIKIEWNRQTGAGKMTSLRSANAHCWGPANLGFPDIYCDQLATY